MKSAKATFLKYRTPLIWGVSILLLYTLIGFLLVPWLAERQLVKTMQQRLGVEARVENIYFNPYTFEVTVDNLHLSNEQYEPLATWDKFYFNLQPLRLFLLKLRFEEITIDSPELHFRRYTTSDNTLTRLADNWNATAEDDEVAEDNTEPQEVSEQDDSLFTLEIGDFNYNHGEIAYRDDVPETSFETVLSPINIHLDHFSTEAGQTANKDLVIALENDAKLTLNGQMLLPSLQFSGQVNLENFSLQTPYRYLQAQLPFELQQGRLDLALAYDIDLADTANIELSEINLDLSGFSLHQPGESAAILQSGTLTASNGRYVFPDNQLSIEDVAAEDFELVVSQNNQGELNWLQLFAPLFEEEADDTADESELQPLQLDIANLKLNNTALTLADNQPESPVNLAVMLSADVQNFSLQDDQQTTFTTQISLDSGGDITLDGQMQLSPTLAVQADAGIDQLSLLPLQPYIDKFAHIEMVSGTIDSNSSFSTNQQEPFAINGNLTLSDVQLENQQLDESLLELDSISINDFDYSLANQQLAISEVIVDALNSGVSIDENGETNLASLIKEQGDTPADSESAPLQLDIASLQLNNSALSVEDNQPESPVNLALMLSAELQDVSLADDQQMPFNSQISLDSGGEITVQGQLQLFPELAVQAETEIAQLSLLPAQPYLNEYAHIEMVSGKLDSTSSITTNPDEPFAINGNLTLSEVQLDNQQLDEKLLGVDTLSINNIDFSLTNKTLAISEVIVDALFSRVLINENGETNLALLMKEKPENETSEAEAETADSESENGYDISLGRVEINNASSRFTDQNLPIVFDTNMQTLNGEISGFSTRSEQPTEIDLEGRVEEFGLVVINGSMNPLNVTGQTTINMAFSNLDLPAMSPYTVKFAGRKIAEGRADVDLTYKITDSDLNASNDIVIHDIVLGERVESQDALDLPLDLAVSLLENSDGEIAINIPVSGNVDDPQFAMGPVIREAIGAALKNIVTAPFRFLGSLIGLGDSDEPIDEIRFRAGRADLAPPEREKLQKLAEALSQRPQLALQIPAPFDETGDRQKLKETEVEEQIDSRLDETESGQQLDEKRQQVLEELYRQAGLSPDLLTLQQEFSASAEGEEQTEPQLDMLSYNAALKERLIEAEPVTVDQLQSLAEQRQQAVVDFIKQNAELNDDQLQTTDNVSTKVDDGWLSMKFDLDTI